MWGPFIILKKNRSCHLWSEEVGSHHGAFNGWDASFCRWSLHTRSAWENFLFTLLKEQKKKKKEEEMISCGPPRVGLKFLNQYKKLKKKEAGVNNAPLCH